MSQQSIQGVAVRNIKRADPDIITELGRYIVGQAGVYISKIIDKKVSRGSTFLIVNGGLHHHLAASGNFGQVIRKNYPVTIANKAGLDTEKASVVGPLCTPLDVLAQDMELPKADIGDFVAVLQYANDQGAFLAAAQVDQGRPGKLLVQRGCFTFEQPIGYMIQYGQFGF